MRAPLTIEVIDQPARSALQQLADTLADPTPVMASISAELLAQVERNFALEGQPAWQKLKPSTIRRRTAKGKWPGQIMQVSNALARSYLPFYSAIEAGVGSNLKYAAIQHFGGAIQRKLKPGTVRLRTDAKGNLMRQGKHGKLAVFARASHKRAVERSHAGKDYTITLPARPVLPVDREGHLSPTALDAVLRVITLALGGP